MREGQGGDHVGIGFRQPGQLLSVIGLGLIDGDSGFRCIGVTTRPDNAVQDDGTRVARKFLAELGDKFDGVLVIRSNLGFRRAEIIGPVHMGFPGLAVQDQTGALGFGKI